MDDRAKRRKALLNLLESREFSSQEDVVSAMQGAGFDVAQPSISRDFRELGIVKVSGRYLPPAKITPEGKSGETWSLVRSVDSVGANLVVVKTTPGAASVVADTIDRQNIKGIAGTVAGDDTIFVATRSRGVHAKLIASLSTDKYGSSN